MAVPKLLTGEAEEVGREWERRGRDRKAVFILMRSCGRAVMRRRCDGVHARLCTWIVLGLLVDNLVWCVQAMSIGQKLRYKDGALEWEI